MDAEMIMAIAAIVALLGSFFTFILTFLTVEQTPSTRSF